MRLMTTSDDAIAEMRKLVDDHGTKIGIHKIAAMADVPWSTAYGWWRRGNVPEWRLYKFDQRREKAK